MPEYLVLTSTQVGLAASLILLNAGVSMALRLGLERSLLIASVRTVVQLLLIGFVLTWVFQVQQWTVVLGLVGFMTIVAGVTAVSRLNRTYDGIYLNTLLSMWASSWLIGIYAITLVFQGIQPWYQPQYVIPLLGMILGNTLNGITIGLNAILESLATEQHAIEMRLSLGANRWEACRPELRRAVRAGLVPIINSMMVVGLVSLPGMMTGQLLSGAAPADAVKYQIVIMFLIASATAIGTVFATVIACASIMCAGHRIESFRIRKR